MGKEGRKKEMMQMSLEKGVSNEEEIMVGGKLCEKRELLGKRKLWRSLWRR